MSENLFEDKEHATEVAGEEVKKDFQGLLGSGRKFLFELLEIRSNTDPITTKESIIADIPFKGHTSWILICSIFIASIGLNANSTAVVIGAMLISPLMGPILGMGLSLAINDIDMLRRSLKNFGVMVVLSVLTAFLFFAIFPLRDESSELLARTAPDIRDVLIAFFGGLALVIARAKKGTIASVIFGVAIATALMPPLCTVGFGLAIGRFDFALGAMYLFTINTIFIALATFLVIKYLRFPMVRYANSKRRRFIARIASVIGLAVMIPAGFTFYNVLQESLFRKQAQEFLADTVEVYQFKGQGRYEDDLTDIHYDKKELDSYLEVAILGTEEVPENIISTWRNKKNKYNRLVDADLRVLQGGRDDSEQRFNYVNELYESKKAELLTKDERIRFLEDEVASFGKLAKNIPFQEIINEAKVSYKSIAGIGFSNRVQTDFSKMDTITLFEIKLKEGLSDSQKEEEFKQITDWLKVRVKDSTIQVREVN